MRGLLVEMNFFTSNISALISPLSSIKKMNKEKQLIKGSMYETSFQELYG